MLRLFFQPVVAIATNRGCNKEGDKVIPKKIMPSQKKNQPQGILTYLGIPFPNKPA